MYIPSHFKEQDQEKILAFMHAHPFATIVTKSQQGLNAEHIPILVNAHGASESPQGWVLQGHIAAANDMWKNENTSDVLVIFQGKHAYITPSWYPSKQRDGKVVPTWNYSAVHARGAITYIQDDAWKQAFLHKLTEHHESQFTQPWAMSDAPEDYIQKLLPAIVGFEIRVSDLTAKFKLSQNQSEENQEGVRKGISDMDLEIAKMMSEDA